MLSSFLFSSKWNKAVLAWSKWIGVELVCCLLNSPSWLKGRWIYLADLLGKQWFAPNTLRDCLLLWKSLRWNIFLNTFLRIEDFSLWILGTRSLVFLSNCSSECTWLEVLNDVICADLSIVRWQFKDHVVACAQVILCDWDLIWVVFNWLLSALWVAT